jgi:hypothetical protein
MIRRSIQYYAAVIPHLATVHSNLFAPLRPYTRSVADQLARWALARTFISF